MPCIAFEAPISELRSLPPSGDGGYSGLIPADGPFLCQNLGNAVFSLLDASSSDILRSP